MSDQIKKSFKKKYIPRDFWRAPLSERTKITKDFEPKEKTYHPFFKGGWYVSNQD